MQTEPKSPEFTLEQEITALVNANKWALDVIGNCPPGPNRVHAIASAKKLFDNLQNQINEQYERGKEAGLWY